MIDDKQHTPQMKTQSSALTVEFLQAEAKINDLPQGVEDQPAHIALKRAHSTVFNKRDTCSEDVKES